MGNQKQKATPISRVSSRARAYALTDLTRLHRGDYLKLYKIEKGDTQGRYHNSKAQYAAKAKLALQYPVEYRKFYLIHKSKLKFVE